MKKIFKYLGLILLLLFIGLGIFAPRDIHISRSTLINNTQPKVFANIARFSMWTAWSPWIEQDTTTKVTLKGNDGMVGSSYHWTSEKIGEGEMICTDLSDHVMNIDLNFLKPFKSNPKCIMTTTDVGVGKTKVDWEYNQKVNFPKNIMMFFMKGMIAKDFDRGLEKMKALSEHP